MVNSIHYIKGILITFSEDSASKVLENLHNPPANPPQFLSAKLLSHQLKGAFTYILGDLQKRVLQDFHWELQPKQKNNWAICLCTFLVLCICVEQIQVTLDGFVLDKISQEVKDPLAANKLRECGVEVCRRLDKCVLEHFWILVQGKLNGITRKHNIFIYGCSIDDGPSHKQSEVDLVNDIYQIMTDFSMSPA